MAHNEFLSLYKPLGEGKTLGPFIADQRLFRLETPQKNAPPDEIRKCLSPRRFQAARQEADPSADSRVQYDMPQGYQWHAVDSAADRENLLADPANNRVCILIEAGIGKTIAMQQIQYLCCQQRPDDLSAGLRFADLPTNEDQMPDHLRRTLQRNPQLKDKTAEVTRLVKRSIETGTLTLVIDSLDERESIDDAQEKSKALGIFLDQNPNVACYVSGRPYSIVDEHWDNLFCRTGWSYIQIDEFNERQQIAYIGTDRHGALERLGASEIAQPRLLESVRQLEKEDLKRIRTEAELYGRVMQRTLELAFNKPNEHKLDQGEVVLLLSLIAFQMTVEGNFRGVQSGSFSEFVLDCFDRCSQTKHSRRYADWEVMKNKIKELGKLNEFIKFAILDKTGKTQIVFRNRTLQAFFAALWIGRFSSSPEEIVWLRDNLFVRADLDRLRDEEQNIDEESNSKRKEELREQINVQQGLYEFWKLLCELGAEDGDAFTCRRDAIWVRSMSALFLPAAEQVSPVRSTEMIYRSFWGLMEIAGCLPEQSSFFQDDKQTEHFDYLVEHDFQDAVLALQRCVRATFEKRIQLTDYQLHLPKLEKRYQPAELSMAALSRIDRSVANLQSDVGRTDERNRDAPQQAAFLLVGFLTEFLRVLHGKVQNASAVLKEFENGFVKIPHGRFLMGSDKHTEKPKHEESLGHCYYLHCFPTTNEVYSLFDSAHQTRFERYERYSAEPNCPTIYINWYDAWCGATWCLGALANEQQWERACRGPVDPDDSRTEYCSGNGENALQQVAWYEENSGGGTHPVAGLTDDKLPNGYGVFHMHGQVWEWQLSWRHDDPRLGKKSGYKGLSRVLRGGSFDCSADLCRSSFRDLSRPQNSSHLDGFRVSRA